MPWSVSHSVFSNLDLGRRANWDKTLAHAEVGDESYEEKSTELLNALTEHLLCGEKFVRFYELEEEQINSLRSELDYIRIDSNIFSSIYPLILPESQLSGDLPSLSISAIHKLEDGIALVLSSRRYTYSRKKFMKDQFEELPKELSKYSEIIGVSYRKYEAFDILWVPSKGNVIEIRADYPEGKELEQVEQAINKAETFLAQKLGNDYFGNKINFFPFIDSIYKNKDEGKIIELGFMVSNSAQKLEKSRRDGTCCRVEAYHLSGIKGLDLPIEVYRIVVMWKREHYNNSYSRPEVGIHGRSTQTLEPHPYLTGISVSRCGGLEDYNFVKDRILRHRCK